MADELLHLQTNFATLSTAVGVAEGDIKTLADKLAALAGAPVIDPVAVQALADEAAALSVGLAASHASVQPAPIAGTVAA